MNIKTELSPLYIACFNNNSPDVESLLKSGANPNVSNEFSPLHIACYKGYLDIIKLLLRHGSKIDSVINNVTSLELAYQNNLLNVVELLIKERANVSKIVNSAITKKDCKTLLLCFIESSYLINDSQREKIIEFKNELWEAFKELIKKSANLVKRYELISLIMNDKNSLGKIFSVNNGSKYLTEIKMMLKPDPKNCQLPFWKEATQKSYNTFGSGTVPTLGT